jgi:hypothetical protein
MGNYMSPTNIFLAVLFALQLGWGYTTVQSERISRDLEAQLADVRKLLQDGTVKIAGLKSELERSEKSLRTLIQDLPKGPTAPEVATALTKNGPQPIVNAVIERLSGDQRFKDSVRGAPGPRGPEGAKPDNDMIAKSVLLCCARELAAVLWQDRRNEIAQHEGLIASVAQSVHGKYGSDLKGRDGRDGRSTPAAEIAKELAGDLGFAQLVADMRSR